MTRDKICLSFFASEEAMDLRELMLDNRSLEFFPESIREEDSGGAGKKQAGSTVPLLANPAARERRGNGGDYGAVKCFDIYFIYWLAGIVPIYDKRGVYEEFIKANSWIRQCLPNWQPLKLMERRDSGKSFSCFYHDLIDLLFGGLEKNAKKLQLKKMPSGLKKIMNKNTQVVINDQVLKLHTKDRREEYRKKWVEKLAEIETEG